MKYFGTISDFFFLLTPEFFSCSSYQLSPCLWQKAASTILCIWAGATWKCKGTFEQIGTIPKGYLLWCMKQSSAGWWPKPLMCMGGGGGGAHGWGRAVKLGSKWDLWLLAVLRMRGTWPREQGRQEAAPEPHAGCVRPGGSACQPSVTSVKVM